MKKYMFAFLYSFIVSFLVLGIFVFLGFIGSGFKRSYIIAVIILSIVLFMSFTRKWNHLKEEVKKRKKVMKEKLRHEKNMKQGGM